MAAQPVILHHVAPSRLADGRGYQWGNNARSGDRTTFAPVCQESGYRLSAVGVLSPDKVLKALNLWGKGVDEHLYPYCTRLPGMGISTDVLLAVFT
jgi:hypothetical protein